jgi:hypothetical protein
MKPLQDMEETQSSPITSTAQPSSQMTPTAQDPTIVNCSDTMPKQLPSKYLHFMLVGLAFVSAAEIFIIHDFYKCVYILPITWFIPCLIYALKDTSLVSAKSSAIISDLVTNYGFKLAGDRPVNENDGSLSLYPGIKIIRTSISGIYKQQEITEFNFQWYKGKNSAGGFPVMKIHFNQDFPPLLVKSKYSQPMVTPRSNARQNNPGLSLEMRLEGEFNQFFSVFTKPDSNDVCLEILTPDVMQYIEDHAKPYSFEFVKNEIYMYDYVFESVSQALAGFELLLGLAAKIQPFSN